MQKLFEICFLTGVLFTLVSFFLGEVFHGLHGLHADIGHIDSGDIHLDADSPDNIVSPLKPAVIAAFITVFGGIGLMCLKHGMNQAISILIAAASGFLVSFLFYRFIIVPLYKAQNTSTVPQSALIGVQAKMKLGVKDGTYGEITYTVKGNSFSTPAKALDNEEIKTGENVEIVSIKDNVFYVIKSSNIKGE